jgi:hypothetical protein
MGLITNVYCLRNVPLKTTCCWWADTGKYLKEELTKSKLENLVRITLTLKNRTQYIKDL